MFMLVCTNTNLLSEWFETFMIDTFKNKISIQSVSYCIHKKSYNTYIGHKMNKRNYIYLIMSQTWNC